jgi:hypothetical protein
MMTPLNKLSPPPIQYNINPEPNATPSYICHG